MSSLFDRLNQELEAFGKRAQAALDEGKSQIELMRVKRQRDLLARELGLFVYRRERGGENDPTRFDALLVRFDDLEKQITALEQEMTAGSSSGSASPPADAEPVTVE